MMRKVEPLQKLPRYAKDHIRRQRIRILVRPVLVEKIRQCGTEHLCNNAVVHAIRPYMLKSVEKPDERACLRLRLCLLGAAVVFLERLEDANLRVLVEAVCRSPRGLDLDGDPCPWLMCSIPGEPDRGLAAIAQLVPDGIPAVLESIAQGDRVKPSRDISFERLMGHNVRKLGVESPVDPQRVGRRPAYRC